MNYAVVTTKVDLQTKRKAMEIANSLGVPLSNIIKALLKQFIKTKTIAFSLQDEIPNKHTRAILKQAEKNLKNGNHSPIFKTGEEAVAWLEKQGI